MQYTVALVAALASSAIASPALLKRQGVTETITPDEDSPAGCSASYTGKFEITAVNSTTSKRDLEKRTCDASGSLTLTLADGVLLDAQARTGYIADNYQFQFDGPAQTGAIYTGGFSVCGNGSLALGGSAIFYQCLSGSFYNLYDRTWAAQCEPILISVLPCSGNVGQIGDGQVTGTGAVPVVTQISDGQVQASTAIIPITELPDGQPQMPTGLVSQISEGLTPVLTQLPDGQPQIPATTAAAVPTTSAAAVVTQISDGQVQVPAQPTATPTTAPAVISQIGDGQIQAPTGKSNTTVPVTTSTPAPITGGASVVGSSFALAFVGLFAHILL